MPNDWYEEFENAHSDGTLPLDTVAKQFRYRRAFIWEVDLFSLGISGKTGVGSWEVRFTSPSGTVIFHQKVSLSLFMVSLGVPGLQLFTWNYVKDEFDTTIAGGQPVTDETIGKYLLGGTAASEQGDMQPSSGQGAVDLTATIIADWYSPIYKMRVPKGTKVTVKADTWGFGPKTVEYSWAFLPGEDNRLDTTFDGLTALVSARGVGDVIQAGRAWKWYRTLEGGGWVKGVEPTIIERADGVHLMALLTEEGYVEYLSHDSEWTWQRALYPDPETGAKAPKAIFPAGVTMPKMIQIDERTRIAMTVQGGQIVTTVVDRNGPVEVVEVGAAGDDESYSIDRDGSGLLVIVDATGIPVYQSRALPLRWTPVESEVAVNV